MLPVPFKPHSRLTRAFARAAERLAQEQRVTRIGFIIDATASREETWERAQAIQAKMFRAVAGLGRLSLRLVHFGGGEIVDHGWLGNPREAAARLARVECVRGRTRILPALERFYFWNERNGQRPDAIILIGDTFEEDGSQIEPIGGLLWAAGVKVFAFLEGEDWTAESAFRLLAERTRGKFAKLGDDLPLSELCTGVALLAAGGEKALLAAPKTSATQLLLEGPTKNGGRS